MQTATGTGTISSPPSPATSPPPPSLSPPPPSNAALPWKLQIILQLRERDQQVNGYQQLFSAYTKLHSQYFSCKQRLFQIEQEVMTSRQHASLMAAPGMGKDQTATTKALEEKILRLQEDLTSAYRLQSENSITFLRLKEQAEKDEKNLIKKEEELAEKHREIALLRKSQEDDNAAMVQRSKHMEQTIELLRGEVNSSRKELKSQELQIQQLQLQNNQLTDQILKLRAIQAEDMNEMNEVRAALQKQQKLADAQAKQLLDAQKSQRVEENKQIQPTEVDLTDTKSLIDHVAWSSIGAVVIPKSRKRSLNAHRGPATCIRYNNAGSLLASCGIDGVVKIYDAHGGSLRASLRATKDAVMNVAWSNDDAMLLAAGNDQLARIWSMKNSKVIHTLIGHQSKIYASLFSLDGELAITGSHDRSIRLWDLNHEGSCKKVILCASSCNYLSMSPNHILASAHLDSHVRLWSGRSGELMHDLEDIHGQQVTSVDFSKQDTLIATNSKDCTVKITDIRTYKVVHTLEGNSRSTYRNGLNWNRAIFSPDGQYVLAGGISGELFIWRVTSGKLESVIACAPSMDGIYGASSVPSRGSFSGSSTSVSVTGATPSSVNTLPETCIACVDWNRNGRQVSSCDQAGFIHQWED